MKYAVMQPYFIPYLGYWQLMAEVDVFVVYDDVQFVKQSWMTRNRLMIANEPSWVSLPVKKTSHQSTINSISLSSELLPIFWKKTRRTILTNYAKADELEELMRWVGVLESLSFKYSNLSDFLFNQLVWINNELELGTSLMRSSKMSVSRDLSRVERLVAFGRDVKSRSYVNSPGGVDLYKEEQFAQYGFELSFFQPRLKSYGPSSVEYVPGLSILDCVAHMSRAELRNSILEES